MPKYNSKPAKALKPNASLTPPLNAVRNVEINFPFTPYGPQQGKSSCNTDF